MAKIKRLEYYFDSKEYTQEEVEQNIEGVKREFPNKKIRVETELNDYGMYIITFYFENRNTILNKIRIFIKNRKEKPLLLEAGKGFSKTRNKTEKNTRIEKYYGKKYGSYKETKQYRDRKSVV